MAYNRLNASLGSI